MSGQIDDETLQNFIPSKEPNNGGPRRKGTTKNWTLHKSHEANQLKKGEVNLIKLLA